MSDEQTPDPDQHGWGSVPPVATIRGTRDAPQDAQLGAPLGAALGSRRARPRRKLRRGQVVGIVAGIVVLSLLLVGGIAGSLIGSSTHSADRPVRAFLDDLVAGKVDAALDDAGIAAEKSDVLLTDAAYAKATAKPTGYRIAAVRDDGDTATVSAYLRQGGQDVAARFTLDQTGTDWGVFPIWELQAPDLGTVNVDVRGPGGATVEVAGRSTTTAKDGSARLRALPGTYDVALDGGKWVQADDGTATVSGFDTPTSTPVELTTTLTDAGQQAAKRAVDAWVDGCIASTDAAPAGCSFYAYGQNPAYTYTNQKWTLDSRPTVSIGDWTSNGWLVSTTTFGKATFTADIAGAGGTGTASAGPLNVNASGYISGFTADGATFRSAVGNGSSDTGS